MKQFTIRHFEKTEEGMQFKEEVLNEEDIRSFGIVNDKQYRRDGGFKKFFKRGFVRTKEHVFIGVMLHQIQEIRVGLRDRIKETKKDPIFAMKRTRYGVQEKRAINWEYKVK